MGGLCVFVADLAGWLSLLLAALYSNHLLACAVFYVLLFFFHPLIRSNSEFGVLSLLSHLRLSVCIMVGLAREYVLPFSFFILSAFFCSGDGCE